MEKMRKDSGVLGLKDLISFKKRMLRKHTWRLIKTFLAICTQALKGIYFPHANIRQAGKGSCPFWGWQRLIVGTEAISQQVVRENIPIREDRS